jgi:hypothetical protein
MGYECIYNANRLREDIMQRRCSYLSYKLCKKNGMTSWWKTYGKRLFSEDLEVRDGPPTTSTIKIEQKKKHQIYNQSTKMFY